MSNVGFIRTHRTSKAGKQTRDMREPRFRKVTDWKGKETEFPDQNGDGRNGKCAELRDILEV